MAAENESDKDDDLLAVEVSVKDAGLWEKTVSVTVAAADVNQEFNSVLGELAGKVNLPGFRAGKVPKEVVERKFGADVKRQVAGNLLQQAVYSAIEKEGLNTIGEPSFEAPEKIAAARGQPFTFEFTTEIFPQFELPPYTGLKSDKEEIDVLPAEMDEALERIRERFAEEAPAEEGRAMANKDSAAGVLRVLVDGVEVHTEKDARLLVVDGHVFGAHGHIADSYLLGAKVGEKRVIEEALADSFPIEEQRGKKATIEFEVQAIRSLHLPPLDDELAKKVNMPDAQSLKDRVHASLLEKIRDTIEDRTANELLRQIEEKVSFELPPRALQHAATNNLSQNIQQRSKMGITPAAMGISTEMMAGQSLEHGKKELRRFFILSAIADKENLVAEEEEVDDVILNMSRQQQVPVQQLFDKLAQEGQIQQIETNIRFKKAMEWITDNAELTVVPRKPFNQDGGHDHGHDHGEHAEHGHEHGEAGHDHGEQAPAVSAEHGHEHGHDCGHDHGDAGHAEHGHDCGHDHGGHDHGHS